MTSADPSKVDEMRRKMALARSGLLRANAGWIPEAAFRQRKAFFVAKVGGWVLVGCWFGSSGDQVSGGAASSWRAELVVELRQSTAPSSGAHHGYAAVRRQAGCTGAPICCPLPLWRHLLQDTGVFHEKVEKPDMQQMMMTNPDMMQVGGGRMSVGWVGRVGWSVHLFCGAQWVIRASVLRSTVGDPCICSAEHSG